ncbi:MAG: hypothetical protein A2X66_04890 [Ignavibacteria bacterium GWA2_54_16]|nr:MAG: hypothetical protein A2X66_04890 [Ignavibacteria bacterium GWA2_54_16]
MILEVISRILTPACPTEFWKAGPVVRDPEKRDRQRPACRQAGAKTQRTVQMFNILAALRLGVILIFRF